MVNPASIMKIMGLKNQFTANHPKFAAFFERMVSQGVGEGDIIEIAVTKVDGTPITANMRVTQEDLALLEELKRLVQ